MGYQFPSQKAEAPQKQFSISETPATRLRLLRPIRPNFTPISPHRSRFSSHSRLLSGIFFIPVLLFSLSFSRKIFSLVLLDRRRRYLEEMAGEKWVLMVTAQTPTNIAVIKYWGKRDEALILPVNDSISVTLDPSHLCTITTVAVSPSFEQDRMWLNRKVTFLSVSLSLSLIRWNSCHFGWFMVVMKFGVFFVVGNFGQL